MKPEPKAITYPVTFEDLLFLNRNKEYGAYALRKTYKMHLTIAWMLAVTLFTMGVSSLMYLREDIIEKIQESTIDDGIYHFTPLPIPVPAKPASGTHISTQKPAGKTVDFKAPVVTVDNGVIKNGVPTKQQLESANPSTVTGEGYEGIIDQNTEYYIAESIKEAEPESIAEKEHLWVEKMPTYPGGQEALYSAVTANIVYPDIAKRAGIIGKVLLSFVIERDGSISNIKVEKGIGGGCDEAAAKAVLMLSKWNPGIQNGNPVRVRMIIPIFFRLG